MKSLTRVSKRSLSAPSRKPKRTKPSSRAIVPAAQPILSIPEAIEKVLILGDLSSLSPSDRIDYYNRVCRSLALNPLTMPFSYILFREFDGAPAKLSLYANKSCTEQLRKIHGVSVDPPLRRSRTEDIVTVEADVHDKTGRTDSASGSVPLFKIKEGQRIALSGKELCNAEMKCETKAKRRATLSICGLAFLDESELDTMEVLGGVTPQGRIYYREQLQDGSKEAAQKVLEAKLAGKMPLNPPAEPKSEKPALFFAMHGEYAEFVNLREVSAGLDEAGQEALRQMFKPFIAQITKTKTVLVSAGKLQELLERLAGDAGIAVRELKNA